jgi:hypothetical protein
MRFKEKKENGCRRAKEGTPGRNRAKKGQERYTPGSRFSTLFCKQWGTTKPSDPEGKN